MNNKLQELLHHESEFIFNNEESFLKQFCCIKYPEMTKVSFSSEYVHFYFYDINSGQHFTDSVNISSYINWKESILND